MLPSNQSVCDLGSYHTYFCWLCEFVFFLYFRPEYRKFFVNWLKTMIFILPHFKQDVEWQKTLMYTFLFLHSSCQENVWHYCIIKVFIYIYFKTANCLILLIFPLLRDTDAKFCSKKNIEDTMITNVCACSFWKGTLNSTGALTRVNNFYFYISWFIKSLNSVKNLVLI